MSEDEKNIKRDYGRNRYHNMSKEKKERLKEYQKIIVKQKSLNLVINIEAKQFFNIMDLIVYAMISPYIIKYITFMPSRLTEIKV